MVARLVPIRHEKVTLTRALQPRNNQDSQDRHNEHNEHNEQDKQNEHGLAAPGEARRPPRGPPGPPAPQHTRLSIRSAERRRWSADLTRPDVTALVVCGVGGIGKSRTLATQIASRMSRLAPERVVTVLSGEVSAACLAAAPAETELVVLDNFDDNLSGPGGQRAVRDPALAAVLASWTGKLLITCGAPFTGARRPATPRAPAGLYTPATPAGTTGPVRVPPPRTAEPLRGRRTSRCPCPRSASSASASVSWPGG